MNRIVNWLENYVLPVANRLAQIRWLVALRNAFISIMPITIAGSLAVLIKSLILAARDHLGWYAFAFALRPLVGVCDIVWRGTFSLFALFLAASLGYQLAATFEADRLAGALISLTSFMMSVANYVRFTAGKRKFVINKAFDISQFSTTGVFTAILFGSLGFAIYLLCYRARLWPPLQTNFPQAEQAAFDSLLPSLISLFSIAVLNFIFQLITGTYFGNWLLHSIQLPLIKMGQGFGMILLVTLLIQIFSFFGLNGLAVLAPIVDSIWLTAENMNITAAKNGQIPHFLWVRGSFDVFAWFGGTGGTLALILTILIFSKRSDYRTVAKVALAPGIFNINEPVVYGLPIVLNPIYFIPFVVAPLVNVAFSYWITLLGLVNPVQAAVPSVMPPIIGPFLACNYDWRAIVLSIINLILAIFIWLPFVLAADRLSDTEQKQYYSMTEY